MKIIQITDLHIDEEYELPFDIDVRDNFLRILKAVKKHQPNHVVLTGDLCSRVGDLGIYNWIREQMDQSELSYDVISGNHDDSVMMAEAFELEHLLTRDELFFAKKIGPQSCIFLDSSKGAHSDDQLNWLRRQLKNMGEEDVIVFMHHPPVKAGVPFMDNNHSLRDMKEVQKIFFSCPGKLYVFVGHYHVEKTICVQNVLVQITPSSFFQIDMREEEFKVDHHRIAYRVIETVNGRLSSTLYYLKGGKKVK